MVYAFIIHTVGSRDILIPYYKIYTCFVNTNSKQDDDQVSECSKFFSLDGQSSEDQFAKTTTSKLLFNSVNEKKELLPFVANKVHMYYSLKMKQALIPVAVESDTKMTGVFVERHWKTKCGTEFVVVWQGVRGFGFTLLCKKEESIHQAHAVLDTIITQLESQLKFLSEPAVAVKLVETVSLVISNLLPGGQLIFANSKMTKSIAKKIEVDLYAK